MYVCNIKNDIVSISNNGIKTEHVSITDILQYIEQHKIDELWAYDAGTFGPALAYEMLSNGWTVRGWSDAKQVRTFAVCAGGMGEYIALKITAYKVGRKLVDCKVYSAVQMGCCDAADMEERYGYDERTDDEEISSLYRYVSALPSYTEGKLTIGACAWSEWQRLRECSSMVHPYIDDDADRDMRKAYWGGIMYRSELAREYHGRGTVLDINGMYAYILSEMMLPIGQPKYNDGWPDDEEDETVWPLHVYHLVMDVKLKDGKMPIIKPKNSCWVVSSDDKAVRECSSLDVWMTDIDYALVCDAYDVTSCECIESYSMRGATGLFRPYILEYVEVKKRAKREHNMAAYDCSKGMLTRLYGKMGQKRERQEQVPVIEGDRVVMRKGETVTCKTGYLPVALYVTAYSRQMIYGCAEMIGADKYLYSDTDSIHTTMTPEECEQMGIWIDDYELGAFKVEEEFTDCNYYGVKKYSLLLNNGKYKTAMSGLSRRTARATDWNKAQSGDVIQNVVMIMGARSIYAPCCQNYEL